MANENALFMLIYSLSTARQALDAARELESKKWIAWQANELSMPEYLAALDALDASRLTWEQALRAYLIGRPA